ncbi:hypothetical protein NU688_33025 [Variovorax sp. ZS18.2.2]|uniref:hypothetical protein n=1 Tax=Variovorax sp. ZS18.2.2 TaxID=2971255 RepID=UPI0021510219|nr:hypothetical protein [Variovorax sp. ZS18.2.2]MCR6481021.1 hypothetical protein [Variovorax sp. ZS18.2.2]
MQAVFVEHILMHMEPDKKQRGRPPTPPEEKLELRAMRLKPAHWKKIEEFGMPWLRRLIERAKGPSKPL